MAGIYHSPIYRTFDNRTLFLHWDYYEETLKSRRSNPSNVARVLDKAPRPSADASSR